MQAIKMGMSRSVFPWWPVCPLKVLIGSISCRSSELANYPVHLRRFMDERIG